MKRKMSINRRDFLKRTGQGAIASTALGALGAFSPVTALSDMNKSPQKRGVQRLSLDKLKEWEDWGYGMFIHFGLSTFAGWLDPVERKSQRFEIPPISAYNPDKLDVDQWVSVARDSGMKYVVLTAKHEYGHCLWPSEHTDFTVARSPNQTDVVEKLVQACQKRGVKPGLYYCSSDLYNLFGSVTRAYAKRGFMQSFPKTQDEDLPPYTTSVYQTFMTAQITELLTKYGPISEMWIDLPGELGRGYRTFLYNYMAELQPGTYIMMNKGTPDSTKYDYLYSFPSDLLGIETGMPPESGYQRWRTVEGKEYYMPGEVCDPIGKNWFYSPSDPPRSNLLEQYLACQQRGVNLLLNVPPDKHGLIPDEYIKALMDLRKNAKI
jgi:alpha-L-fucosidase